LTIFSQNGKAHFNLERVLDVLVKEDQLNTTNLLQFGFCFHVLCRVKQNQNQYMYSAQRLYRIIYKRGYRITSFKMAGKTGRRIEE
jgi:hypothetical protein